MQQSWLVSVVHFILCVDGGSHHPSVFLLFLWQEDADKCTFIVLAKDAEADVADGTVEAEVAAMAGDVNLFFHDHDDPRAAEIDIMVAEPGFRGKGIGREATRLMMW